MSPPPPPSTRLLADYSGLPTTALGGPHGLRFRFYQGGHLQSLRHGPDLLVNLGTCGGFEGRIARGTVILVNKTIVYDIIEQMSDPNEAIFHYSTELDLSWLPDPLPHPVACGLLVSGDRDIQASDIPGLVEDRKSVV